MKRTVRIAASFVFYLLTPGVVLYGLLAGWSWAGWEISLGLVPLVSLAAMVLALGGKVDPLGGGRVGISGDEIGRQG